VSDISIKLVVFNACLKEHEKEHFSAVEVKCIIDTLLVKVENKKATTFRTLHKNRLVALNMPVTYTSV
jgi:hypothetical protein